MLPSIGGIPPVLQRAGHGCPPGPPARVTCLARLLDPNPIPDRVTRIDGPLTGATEGGPSVAVVPYPPRFPVPSARPAALVTPPVVERVRPGVSVPVHALSRPGSCHADDRSRGARRPGLLARLSLSIWITLACLMSLGRNVSRVSGQVGSRRRTWLELRSRPIVAGQLAAAANRQSPRGHRSAERGRLRISPLDLAAKTRRFAAKSPGRTA